MFVLYLGNALFMGRGTNYSMIFFQLGTFFKGKGCLNGCYLNFMVNMYLDSKKENIIVL